MNLRSDEKARLWELLVTNGVRTRSSDSSMEWLSICRVRTGDYRGFETQAAEVLMKFDPDYNWSK